MDLNNKTCIITGANSGMGFAAAKQFAKAGANVVLVCRDITKGSTAVSEIKKDAPDCKIELMVCNLASTESISNFVKKFKDTHSSLHLLFNNAAVMKSRRSMTEDGFETMFQTNYLAPVMLTESLLEILKSNPPSRIINIAVPGDKLSIDFNDLQSLKQYKTFDAFMKTKLYLLLYTLELSKRLSGTGVIVNSIDPGMFRSSLSREFPWLLRKMMGLFAQSPDQAAAKIVYHALSNEFASGSGKIFVGKDEKNPIPYWKDEDVQKRLWSITMNLLASLSPNCSPFTLS